MLFIFFYSLILLKMHTTFLFLFPFLYINVTIVPKYRLKYRFPILLWWINEIERNSLCNILLMSCKKFIYFFLKAVSDCNDIISLMHSLICKKILKKIILEDNSTFTYNKIQSVHKFLYIFIEISDHYFPVLVFSSYIDSN